MAEMTGARHVDPSENPKCMLQEARALQAIGSPLPAKLEHERRALVGRAETLIERIANRGGAVPSIKLRREPARHRNHFLELSR